MAETQEFKQAIGDAIKDADSLERFINGGETDDVLTRLNAKYPTIKKALKELFENGGIAGRFKTVAELENSDLTDGDYALVADDSSDKNGIYIKEAGVWSKSKYDPLNQAIDIIDSVQDNIAGKLSLSSDDDLHAWVDSKDDVVGKLDKDGHLRLLHLTDSVQNEIKKTKQMTDVVRQDKQEPLHTWTDNNGEIVASITSKGRFLLNGLDDDVVTTINKLSQMAAISSVTPNYTYKDSYTLPAQLLLNTDTGTAKAPLPMHQFKQNFSIGKTWINDLQAFGLANSTKLSVTTPYRSDDGVTHPHILEFYNGFRGYRYIIAITPYLDANDAYENPCIYGSNDLINLELLDGFEQPLDPRPPQVDGGVSAYNSDNVLVYDPISGELVCIWRQTLPKPESVIERYSALWERRTKDGYRWTDKKRIFLDSKSPESNIGGVGSPGLIYDVKSGYWYLYVNRLDSSATALRVFKSKSLDEDSWQYVGIANTGDISGAWHHEVRIIGDKVCILVHQLAAQKSLYFGISDDFLNFSYSKSLFTDNDIYKSSFIPVFDDSNNIALKIMYSTTNTASDANLRWRMHYHQTNFVNPNMEII